MEFSLMETATDVTKLVPLNSIFVAPENPRAELEADEGIPQLGRTLVACQVYPILVRPGKKGEGDYGALDGRRRFLGFQSALAEGLIEPDHLVAVTIVTDKARQHAALTLANHEREAGHITDVIMAIGRMKKSKLKVAAIAAALGYSEVQISRWAKLADLHPDVIKALRQDELSMATAQLMTRLSQEDQERYAAAALRGQGHNVFYSVEQAVNRGIVTVDDPRLGLVSVDEYVAAGGRVEGDLFGEAPDVLLDPDVLQKAWESRTEAAVAALREAGLVVYFGHNGWNPPEGFERLPYNSMSNLTGADRRDYDAAVLVLRELQSNAHPDSDTEHAERPTVAELVLADLEVARKLHTRNTIGCVILKPDQDYGLDATFHASPAPVIEHASDLDGDDETSAEPEKASDRPTIEVPAVRVDVEGINNSLHERYTVVATQGLIRTLADDPNTALTVMVARMFVTIGIAWSSHTSESIATIKAESFRHPKHGQIGELDGEIYDRLAEYKAAYVESGLRPIPWVHSLSMGERMTLLTVLVALSLDGKEFNTGYIRKGARAEAAEIAELTGHDITTYWTPDAAFFGAHSKKQLLPMLEVMGVEDPTAASLKKGDLAGLVAQTAEEHRWAPGALSWKEPEPELVEVDDQEDIANGEDADQDADQADTEAQTDDQIDDETAEQDVANDGYDDEQPITAELADIAA